jgi:hypothetical protein
LMRLGYGCPNRSLQCLGDFRNALLISGHHFPMFERLPLTTRDELLFIKTHRSRGTNSVAPLPALYRAADAVWLGQSYRAA